MGTSLHDLAVGGRRKRLGRGPAAVWTARAGMTAIAVVGLGCPSQGDPPSPSASARATPTAAATGHGATATASGEDAATADGPAQRFAGTWRASFEAKRGAVTLPSGAPDATWADDTGTDLTGKGTMVLKISADGQVSGSVSGALGELSARGVVEEETLRAGLTPADPTAPGAVTGILVGAADGEVLEATLRVSNGDASLVRTATVTLEKR